MDSPSSIDRLLKARAEIDERLRRHKASITVLFTDVVGSTDYFDRYGDMAGLVMIRRHSELGIRTVEEFKGRVIKTIGDSVMAEFPEPAFAARAAVEIQRRLARLNQTLPERDRLPLRIGINAGAAFRDAGDVYGDAVNVAARITKQTGSAQILVSRSLRNAISSETDLCCIPKGRVEMKGKSESEEIFELTWCGGPEYTADLQPLAATGATSDSARARLRQVNWSRWKWLLAVSIAVVLATGGYIVQRNSSILHSGTTLAKPSTIDSTASPAIDTAIPGVSVTVADSLPFYITLDDDIPADGSGSRTLTFTVRDDLKAGDTIVMAKGAKASGSIMGEMGKKILGIWSKKMNFRLIQAETVAGQKLNIRATAGHAGKGPASRPLDTGKGSKPKELAAAKGTEYIGYTDGEQTVSIRK
jgi:class 3 adenylate cyclase